MTKSSRILTAFFSYALAVSATALLRHYFPKYSLPFSAVLLIFLAVVFFKGRPGLNFSLKGILLGFGASAFFLIPYVFIAGDFNIKSLSPTFFLYQMFYVAIPEELFFRGYLQRTAEEVFKSPTLSVILVSLLFALAHLLAGRGIYSLLTFFPSLVMGTLFAITRSVVPGIMFHFFANVAEAAYRPLFQF